MVAARKRSFYSETACIFFHLECAASGLLPFNPAQPEAPLSRDHRERLESLFRDRT